jgi:hypothetical protein
VPKAKGKKKRATVNPFRYFLKQIVQNLTTCPNTPAAEKEIFMKAIRAACRSTASRPPEERLSALANRAHRLALNSNLYLKGPATSLSGKDMLHAKPRDRFKANLETRLADHFDFDTAVNLAEEIYDELVTTGPARTCTNPLVADLGLHTRGTPFWVADSESGKPAFDSDLTLYAARAGLEPRSTVYVLIRLGYREGKIPRFADSSGYPYWRPGGKTNPIEKCPSEYSGFDEAVLDNVSIRDLSKKKAVTFRRRI